MGPMVTQDFTVAKLAILAQRYLHLPKMRNFCKPLLAWVVIKNADTSMTTQTSSWLAALEPCIKTNTVNKLGLLATTSWLQTNGTVQPHWATSHLDTSVKCALNYWLAALLHIPCFHNACDGNGASLQRQLMPLNRLCTVFLALTHKLRYRYTIVWPFSTQVGCLCLSSSFYMASITTKQHPSVGLDIQCSCHETHSGGTTAFVNWVHRTAHCTCRSCHLKWWCVDLS